MNHKNFAVKLELVRVVDHSRLIDETLNFRRPKDVATFLEPLRESPVEHFICLFCDAHGQCIGTMEFSNHEERSVRINIRAICAAAALCGAEGVAIAHNHPSILVDGYTKFSPEDFTLADSLRVCLKMFGVELFDSVLISGGAYTSWTMQKAAKKKQDDMDPYERGDFLPTKEYFMGDEPLTPDELTLEDVKAEDPEPLAAAAQPPCG